jgi:hypothetical protein
MVKFDLRSGYHHVDINNKFQRYLGFSWEINGQVKYFVFSVLTFGLTSAPFLFTKLMRCSIVQLRNLILTNSFIAVVTNALCFIADALFFNKTGVVCAIKGIL